ncbi:MAG: quinone-dependent dihydroorotate dehydrogenase [Saprospiraceae bacterium]|nr:quinone-dependent dihydroorotate dehydrogenase [Saprospiraceae bacterium]
MYRYLKPLLFSFQPETAHRITVSQLSALRKIPGLTKLMSKSWSYESPVLKTEKMGLSFKNPVGLAAGFDKNGSYVDSMRLLGFGFIEVGTITPLAQPGNDKPRLFRLPEDEALINRMGFNNDGVDRLVDNLKILKKQDLVIGGNIGKNKVTPNESAVEDYLICFRKLFDYVDYFVVNVSSPNTPGLRSLQEKEPLTKLLGRLQEVNRRFPRPKPILLKIAPDLNQPQLDDILTVVSDQSMAGIIATNTSLDRSGLHTSPSKLDQIGAGGLSGAPILNRSAEVIRYIRENTPSHFVIIGVGGIMSAEDALRIMDNGADLIQIYTGLIYQGPTLVRQINKAIMLRRQQSL